MYSCTCTYGAEVTCHLDHNVTAIDVVMMDKTPATRHHAEEPIFQCVFKLGKLKKKKFFFH